MNRVEATSPPPLPLDRRRATLRARPSGLKGRYRDRCATDLQPALDPGASTAPSPRSSTGSRRAAARQARGAEHKHQDQIPTTKSLRFQGIARASSTSRRDGFAIFDTSDRQRRIAGYEEAVGVPLFRTVS
jgi:hypothetical protein